MDTADVLALAFGGVPVVVEPDLVECDFGEWEGLTFAEVRRRWPTELGKNLGSLAKSWEVPASLPVALRRSNMDPARRFVKRVNTTYCAWVLGQTQDVPRGQAGGRLSFDGLPWCTGRVTVGSIVFPQGAERPKL